MALCGRIGEVEGNPAMRGVILSAKGFTRQNGEVSFGDEVDFAMLPIDGATGGVRAGTKCQLITRKLDGPDTGTQVQPTVDESRNAIP